MLALGLLAGTAEAAHLKRDVVGNGATASAGGGLRLAGTAAQLAVGRTSGSARVVGQGFRPPGRLGSVSVDSPAGGATWSSRVELGPASPNPARGSVSLSLALPLDAGVVLQLLDVQGRLVSSSSAAYLSAGYHVVTLAVGTRASPPAGVFFVRLLVDGREHGTSRFVRLD